MTDKFDASDQIVNSKSDLVNMVRILTMQRDKLAEEVEDWKANYNKATDACVALRAENERLRKALEFYASSWWGDFGRPSDALERDGGKRARATLQSKQGE